MGCLGGMIRRLVEIGVVKAENGVGMVLRMRVDWRDNF